jgi:acyl CoA:acetate/3-ketoacid CoA transferase beta subunit
VWSICRGFGIFAGKGVVSRVITELCVLDNVPGKGLTLTELAEGVEVAEVLAKTACKLNIADDIKRF